MAFVPFGADAKRGGAPISSRHPGERFLAGAKFLIRLLAFFFTRIFAGLP